MKKWYGMFTGFVVNNKDTKNWGRVQVRILCVHGTKEQTKDDFLPWALVSSFFGGFYDGGSYTPFPVGSTVVVGFEQGDCSRPIIFGGIQKSAVSHWVYGQSDEGMEVWHPKEEGTDVPKEGHENKDTCVVFKTPKGAIFYIEEVDEGERLRIVDRGGQVVEMACPVKKDKNKANAEQRGIRDVLDSETVPYDSVVACKAHIKIVDLAGQSVSLFAEKDKERIEFRSQNKDGSGVQTIVLDTSKGSEFIKITDKSGQFILLDAVNKKIFLQGEGNSDHIVPGDENFEIGGNNVKLINGDEELSVMGKKEDTIGDNWTVSVGGNVEIEAGMDVKVKATTMAIVEAPLVWLKGAVKLG